MSLCEDVTWSSSSTKGDKLDQNSFWGHRYQEMNFLAFLFELYNWLSSSSGTWVKPPKPLCSWVMNSFKDESWWWLSFSTSWPFWYFGLLVSLSFNCYSDSSIKIFPRLANLLAEFQSIPRLWYSSSSLNWNSKSFFIKSSSSSLLSSSLSSSIFLDFCCFN